MSPDVDDALFRDACPDLEVNGRFALGPSELIGGVRLEDLFLVTDDGWERLTHHPMDLSTR